MQTNDEASEPKAPNPASVWRKHIAGFKSYILMERSYSPNTLESYLDDCEKFFVFMETTHPNLTPQTVELKQMQQFLKSIVFPKDRDEETRLLKVSTQRRIISGVRAYFKYLLLSGEIERNPCDDLETAKMEKRLPVVLTNEEVERMLASIDRSTYHGYRDAVIIEVLYSCGLRISELLNLKLSDVFPKEEYIRVTGKGNKRRLVPIGESALKDLQLYVHNHRSLLNIAPKCRSVIFLNRYGRQLTRQYVFQAIKRAAQEAGIKKNIHPHTLRHSFGTALIKGGANLIAVRDMMGHASVVSTDIYTHVDVEHLKETLMLYHPYYKDKPWNEE